MSGALLHGTGEPSEWIKRWSHLVAPQGSVLDVACGMGRHMNWFARLGHPVTGIDRSADAIAGALAATPGAETIVADIENGPWPLDGRSFDAVVVTNYLWRPLMPTLLASLAPGGVLLYETFSAGNETVGKPSRPDFLLQPGELLARCAALRIVAFEDGFMAQPARFVQRIAAIMPLAGELPARYPL